MKPQLPPLSLSATLCQDQYTEEFTQLCNLGRHPLPTPGLELLSHWSRPPSIYPELIRVFTYWLHLLWKSTPLGACVLRFVGLVHQWAFLFLHLYSPQRLRSCWVGHVASFVLGSPRPSCHTAACAASPQRPLAALALTARPRSTARSAAHRNLSRSTSGWSQLSPSPLWRFDKCGAARALAAAKQHVAQLSPACCSRGGGRSFWVPLSGIQLPGFMRLIRTQLSLGRLSNVVELG